MGYFTHPALPKRSTTHTGSCLHATPVPCLCAKSSRAAKPPFRRVTGTAATSTPSRRPGWTPPPAEQHLPQRRRDGDTSRLHPLTASAPEEPRGNTERKPATAKAAASLRAFQRSESGTSSPRPPPLLPGGAPV